MKQLHLGFALMALFPYSLAGAEIIEAPRLLQYSPNMLAAFTEASQVPFQGALPAGSGGVIVAFAHLLGVIAVWRSLSLAHTISSTSSPYSQPQGNWGTVLAMFTAGICVVHLERTMGTLAATIPGFPDLTPLLNT